MAGSIAFSDLVRESSATTGSDNFVLDGAAAGYRRFGDSLATGAQFHYSAIGVDKPQEVEVGIGTLEPDGSIARAPVAGQFTNFTNGTKTIALVAGASWFTEAEAGLAAAASAQGRLDLLEQSQPVQDSAIAALESGQVAQDSAIAALDGARASQASAISALESSQTAQDDDIAGKAPLGHDHSTSEIIGLDTELARLDARGDRIFRPEEYGLTPGADPAATREAIAAALAAAAAQGGTLLLSDLYVIDVADPEQSLFLINNPARLRIVGRHPACGIRLIDDAGNYPAIFDFKGSAQAVEFIGFTIDENGAGNSVAVPTAGSTVTALNAVRINTVATDGIRISGMRFIDCAGINTLNINYSETTRDCLIDGNFFRFAYAGTTGGYDNSAIYINGRSYCVRDNRFRGPGIAEGGRTAIEVHGFDFIVANNLVEGYRIGINFVSTNTIVPVATNAVVTGNIVRAAEIGLLFWAITGHVIENFAISGNIFDIDPGFDPASGNRSGGIVIASGAGITGSIASGIIHHNIVTHRDFVGNGSNPDNDSAGICLDQPAGSMSDLVVSNNVVRNAPNIGISIYSRSGISQRVHVLSNQVVDAGHNVANGLRFCFLWRGVAEQCSLIGNKAIDTGTTGSKGHYGVYTYFVAEGSSLIERDNITAGSGGDDLDNRSSAGCFAWQRVEMAWPSPRLALGNGARRFSVELTSPQSTTFLNDNSAQPTVARDTEIQVRFKNVSGGAVAIVPDSAFKLAGAFENPADGETAIYSFLTPDGGASWIETGRSIVPHG